MTHGHGESTRPMHARAVGALGAAAVFVVGAPGLSAAGSPETLPVPTDPSDPSVTDQWVNPNVREGEGALARLAAIEAPDSVQAHDPFHVKLRVTNTSERTLEGLSIVPRRGPLTGSVADQRMATIAATGEYGVAGERVSVDKRIAPGESAEIDVDLHSDSLGLSALGTYPVSLVLVDANGAPLDSERFHLTVRGRADGAAPGGMTALYPIAAPVDIVPGETGEAPEEPQLVLASDALATEIAPGGRLDQLVDGYLVATQTPAVREATCAAIDPALVDTVDRMSRGYVIAQERQPVVKEPQRLRDSWGSHNDDWSATPGPGQDDAAAFLEKLRQLSAQSCTVALPWANADLDAVARTGDPWLMREAIERGPTVLERILGNAGMLNTVVPGNTALEGESIPALGWADHSRSTVAEEGMQAAWERTEALAAQAAAEHPGVDALEANTPGSASSAAAPKPVQTVRVLLPGNTIESGSPAGDVSRETSEGDGHAAQRFAWAAPNVLAVGYQDDLASVLATVGPAPTTVSYAPEVTRFDYTMDSDHSRAVNAASAIRLAAQQAWTWEGEPATEPVLVNPPATWDAEAASVLLGTVADLVTNGGAQPVSLNAYLDAPAEVPGAANVGTQYSDPGAFTDSEIMATTQQARFTNDLTELLAPDPSIALTRYGYTLPLRRDLITALSTGERRSVHGYSDAAAATSGRLAGSRDTLTELRSSVALIPPGNVYTRTSPSSPLLIVAQNGMPLPVQTSIQYRGPEGATLNVPREMRIPARGSVTVQMTADLPEAKRGTDLQLFLAGPKGAPMSQPVDITVRTAAIAVRGWVFVAALGAVVTVLLALTVGRKRRSRAPNSGEHAPAATGNDPPPQAPPTQPPNRQPHNPDEPPNP
ncbi:MULTISPECIES: hypothetical protein [Corynebacterium]|uniref:Secreted protein n=1 Tax=Corynebacterium hadale TaxID=2026255 RepID=A0A269PBR2_9CORY|nr:hypothetical protein [Corynebacterium hadale]PAJ68944.1 hypothetical protein CIG21_09770 [Corynebacterium hadale]WKC61357.1 hypothetical protein CHAD_12610 [Corynebacterium hadale]